MRTRGKWSLGHSATAAIPFRASVRHDLGSEELLEATWLPELKVIPATGSGTVAKGQNVLSLHGQRDLRTKPGPTPQAQPLSASGGDDKPTH